MSLQIPNVTAAAVFGDDNRQKLTPEHPVYAVRGALGRVTCRHPETGQKRVGTAAVVDTGTTDEGHEVLLTAAHVVMDPSTGKPLNDCRFKVAGRLWGSDAVSGIRTGAFDGRPETNAEDWAVVLTAPQEPAQHRLPLWDGSGTPDQVMLLGLRGDRRGLWVSDHCFARPPRPDEALHGERVLLSDCDAGPGTSGAPLLVRVEGTWYWGGLYRGHLYDPKSRPERPDHQAAFSGRNAMNVIVELPLPASHRQRLDGAVPVRLKPDLRKMQP